MREERVSGKVTNVPLLTSVVSITWMARRKSGTTGSGFHREFGF
jgi:hypothetical protein